MKCDIIIPIWNQLVFTKSCIDSIFKNTDVDYRIIIIDNASNDETKSYLDDIKTISKAPVIVLRNEKNLGFIKAVNQGIRCSDAPYICVLNNDTLVTEGWLRIMLEIADRHEDIGVVNPSSNTLGQGPTAGEPMDFYAQKLKPLSDKFVELGAAVGFCMLIKKTLIERIGVFDEIYGMGNFEDTDFSRRVIREGFRCVRACGAYVYHRESTSFNRLKTFEDDFKRNREIFEFRWGRPKRVAYILGPYDNNVLKRLNTDALRLARLGNWVLYISKDAIEMPEHSNIQFTNPGKEWFYLKAIFTILKKKKKFDQIFIGDERLAIVLNNLSFIHNAKVSYY